MQWDKLASRRSRLKGGTRTGSFVWVNFSPQQVFVCQTVKLPSEEEFVFWRRFDEAGSMTDYSVVAALSPNSACNLVDMYYLIERYEFAIMPIFSV